MVVYVPDKTGRFARRPHYEPKELDRECEGIVGTYLKEKYGKAEFPISTEDLTVIIEREVETLDQYADLTGFGPKVEGITYFQPGRRPRVAISQNLSLDDNRATRLRTTLAHEYGHVHFHAYLWESEPPGPDLLKSNPRASMQVCYRDTMLDAAMSDWMEWQAGYVCGAILMPASRLRQLAGEFLEEKQHFGAMAPDDSRVPELIERVRGRFDVSGDAARIRLLKLGVLGAVSNGPSLFDSRSQ